MNPFLHTLVQDLRAFANEMLETGLAPTAHLELEDVRAPSMAALLEAIRQLHALVPVLIEDLEHNESSWRTTRIYSHSPVGGFPSRHPAHYQSLGNRGLVPTQWVRTVPVLEPDTEALAWLAHLLQIQEGLLETVADRTRKQIAEARISRRGSSSWAQADAADLDAMERALGHAEERLRRSRGLVRRANASPLLPSSRLPSPFPRSQAWGRLRTMARDLTEPGRALPKQLRIMLSGSLETADVPYLYQRWCGVKLLQMFEMLRWDLTTDPVGPLLLGGRIRLERGGQHIDIWVEPRLTSGREHPSGFQCVSGPEVTPDFLILVKGPSRYDAFVLDATMTNDQEVILGKGKYLDLLRSAHAGFAAGMEVFYKPRRSWAAAPLQGGISRLFTPSSGAWGVIPMNPARWRPSPLEAWVRDVDLYARAWASVEDDPRFIRHARGSELK